MKKPTRREIFSIPNIMGYFRILMIPVVCWLYLTAETKTDYLWAAAVLLISSSTDLFDGMIARKFNMVTELGKVLDPIADKLTHAAMAFCLAVRYPLMWALIGLMVIKEGYMAVMGIKFLKKGKMMDGAMWFGKICTATLFVGLLVLFFLFDLPQAVVTAIIVIMMVVMLLTLCLYIPFYARMKRETEAEENKKTGK